MFGVAGAFNGVSEALLLQFDYFVNGQELTLDGEDYSSQHNTYLLLYMTSSIVLFLLFSQAPWLTTVVELAVFCRAT